MNIKELSAGSIEMPGLELMQHYKWENPWFQIETVRGTIKYSVWLERERDRISRDPDRIVEIRTNKKGEVALFVNQIAGL